MSRPECNCPNSRNIKGHYNDCPVMMTMPEFEIACELFVIEDRLSSINCSRAAGMLADVRMEIRQAARDRIEKEEET